MSRVGLSDVYEALLALVEPGARTREIATHQGLMELEAVVAAATDHGRTDADRDTVATAATVLVAEAGATLSPIDPKVVDEGRAVLTLLGLAEGSTSDPLRHRRGRCAGYLRIKPATLGQRRGDRPTRLERLVETLAERLYKIEIEHRTETARIELREKLRPAESALAIDWIGRFEIYYGMWSSIGAVFADVKIALQARKDSDEARHAAFGVKSLFYYAKYLVGLERFMKSHGGFWIMADAEREQAVADATYHIKRWGPFSEEQDSDIRIAMAFTTEMAVFLSHVQDNPILAVLLTEWMAWLQSCRCEPDVALSLEADCLTHRVMAYCDAFVTAVDRDWDAVADWYQIRRPTTSIDQAALHVERRERHGADRLHEAAEPDPGNA